MDIKYHPLTLVSLPLRQNLPLKMYLIFWFKMITNMSCDFFFTWCFGSQFFFMLL